MKKQHITLQLIISIATFTYTGIQSGSQEALLQAEDAGQTIRTALTTGWRIAKNNKENTDASDTIAKGIDAFGILFEAYLGLLKRQPSLEVQVTDTIDTLKQSLTQAQTKLREARAKEADLAKAQAELITRTGENNDLQQKVQALQEENTKLKEQLTLTLHA